MFNEQDQSGLDALVLRMDSLERIVREVERRSVMVQHWHNTLDTPMWKKIIFFVQGYKPWSLGTWYTARWNKAMGDKYNGVM